MFLLVLWGILYNSSLGNITQLNYFFYIFSTTVRILNNRTTMIKRIYCLFSVDSVNFNLVMQHPLWKDNWLPWHTEVITCKWKVFKSSSPFNSQSSCSFVSCYFLNFRSDTSICQENNHDKLLMTGTSLCVELGEEELLIISCIMSNLF